MYVRDGREYLTYGEYLRCKSIGFNGCFPTRSNGAGRGDATAQKLWDKECEDYRKARAEGIQPRGTTRRDIDTAVRLSDKLGRAVDLT